MSMAIQAGSQVIAEVTERACQSVTQMGSFLASSIAAAAVGSTVFVGGKLYDLYAHHSHERRVNDTCVTRVEGIEDLEKVTPDIDADYTFERCE